MATRLNSTEEARALGARIRLARHKSGKTLAQVDKETGVNHGQLSKIERGMAVTVSNNVRIICTFFDIQIPRSDDYPSTQASAEALARRVAALAGVSRAHSGAIERFVEAMEIIAGNASR